MTKELMTTESTKVYEKDFVDVFSILIIQLNLSAPHEKGWRSLVGTSHPYCFEVADAIEGMRKLELFIELKLVTTTIRYAIRADLAAALLAKFFSAHLIHDPASRTSSNLKSVSRAQITPKGAALVWEFCKSIGMPERKMPPVVFSTINTMHLFHFDRSPSTGKVLHSEFLNHALLSTLFGAEANVWQPDQVPVQARNLALEESGNSGKDAGCGNKGVQKGKNHSPFYHRYFSNPQSDAHIQYYESGSGIRLFYNKKFTNKSVETVVEYCFSGKALVQWLCDCTTLYSVGEASEIGQLLLDQRLITPLTVSTFAESFYNHPDAIYAMSESGMQSCRWLLVNLCAGRTLSDPQFSPLQLSLEQTPEDTLYRKRKIVSLDYVLSDPGMRYLFRMHLEKESCIDNFEAYVQLLQFVCKKFICNRLIRDSIRADQPEKKRELRLEIENFTTSNTLMAFHLYSKYFSVESIYNLNIGFGMQQELDFIIANVERSPSSPIRSFSHDLSTFAKTPDIDKRFNSPESGPETGGEVSPPTELPKIEECAESDRTLDSSQSFPTVELGSNVTSDDSGDSPVEVACSDIQQMELTSKPSTLDQSIKDLTDIWKVFDRVAASLYSMMESDLFPKFVRSQEYLIAMDAVTEAASALSN